MTSGHRHHGGRRRRRWLGLMTLATAAGLVALFYSTRRPTVAPPVAANFAAGADSLNAATRRHDWAGAEQWAERLAIEQPRNGQVLYELALSLHNHSTAMTPRFNRPRSALRLSLDRIAAETRVMALLDSAARVAATPDDWARAQLLRGMAFEGLGLPIEALECYRAVNTRMPKLGGPAQRLRWVIAHLADPRLPDLMVEPEPGPEPQPTTPSAAPPPAPATPAPAPPAPDSTPPATPPSSPPPTPP